MFKIKNKRVISSLLSIALVFGLLGSSVVSTSAATSVTRSGGTGTSKVTTTIAPSIFSATVPYVLPISIDADQNVYTADNVAIVNNSNGPIKVSDATLTTNEGWELVANGTDFSSVPVNSKQFTMRLMDSPVSTSGSIDVQTFDSINGNSALQIDYDADAAVQGNEIIAQNVANILFTIEWDSYDLTGDVVDKTALNNFVTDNNLKTFQRTSEKLNIDDVMSDSNAVRIDNVATVLSSRGSKSVTMLGASAGVESEPVIYAWADDKGNGYWWSSADKVYLPADSSGLFKNSTLTELDLSNIDTSNVTNMSEMFYGCSNLKSLELSSFNTSNVTDMSYMFYNCKTLSDFDISSFDTSNVVDMSYMFYNLDALTSLDLSNFDTSKVTNMSYMLYGNNYLTSLNVSSFDTSNVQNMLYMFCQCTDLTSLNIQNFNTSKVTDMSGMFGECWSLQALNLSSFDTSNVKDMTYMFGHCEKLTSLDLSSFDTSNVTKMKSMFMACYSLSTLNISSLKTSKVTTMEGMFSSCYALSSLDLSSLDTSNVKIMDQMFFRCKRLNSLDLSNFNTAKVTTMHSMFSGCSNLTSLNLLSFKTSRVKWMTDMFRDCSNLTELDLSSFNTANTERMERMFYLCSNLTTIKVSVFKVISSTTTTEKMFYGCTKLAGQNGTLYDSSVTNYRYARIDTADTPGYFTYKAKAA